MMYALGNATGEYSRGFSDHSLVTQSTCYQRDKVINQRAANHYKEDVTSKKVVGSNPFASKGDF